MAKIRCCVDLKENEKSIFNNTHFCGIKVNNKISYHEDKIMVTILIDDNKIIMKRTSSDYKIVLQFEANKKTIGQYFLNNENLWLPLDIFTDTILFGDSSLQINYSLIQDNNPTKFFFRIKYEVVE